MSKECREDTPWLRDARRRREGLVWRDLAQEPSGLRVAYQT